MLLTGMAYASVIYHILKEQGESTSDSCPGGGTKVEPHICYIGYAGLW